MARFTPLMLTAESPLSKRCSCRRRYGSWRRTWLRRPAVPWPGSTSSRSPATSTSTPRRGCPQDEARSRLASMGPNRLAAGKKEPGWRAFLRQYEDFMQMVLLGAARREPDRHRRDGHDGRAGRPDRVQRGHRAAAGVEGRGERQGAVADDEDDRAGASRRPGGRDRRRGAGARRRRAGRGRQPGARRRPGLRGRDARDRGGGADRREPAGRQVDRPGARRGRAAGRPDLHGLHEHVGHPRPRRADRDGHRHGHRDRPHRRHAGQHRDRARRRCRSSSTRCRRSSPRSPRSRW